MKPYSILRAGSTIALTALLSSSNAEARDQKIRSESRELKILMQQIEVAQFDGGGGGIGGGTSSGGGIGGGTSSGDGITGGFSGDGTSDPGTGEVGDNVVPPSPFPTELRPVVEPINPSPNVEIIIPNFDMLRRDLNVTPIIPMNDGSPVLFLNPLNPDRQEAPPGMASVGVSGSPHLQLIGGSTPGSVDKWSTISSAIAASNAPNEVKARLLSEENRLFNERCDPSASLLADARNQLAGKGFFQLTEAFNATTAEEAAALATAMKAYSDNCLSRPIAIEDQKLSLFVNTRVGILKDENGGVFCTATLITPTELLTARHCVADGGGFIKWDQVTFERYNFGNGETTTVALTNSIVPSDRYANRYDVPYDSDDMFDDYVLLTLSRAIASDSRLPWNKVGIGEPNRYDALGLVSFNAYDAISREYFVANNGGSRPHWTDSIIWDASVPCMAAGILDNKLIAHACQSEGATSGAPLISLNTSEGKVNILGVHTGSFGRGSRFEPMFASQGIDTRAVPNTGNILRSPVTDYLLK